MCQKFAKHPNYAHNSALSYNHKYANMMKMKPLITAISIAIVSASVSAVAAPADTTVTPDELPPFDPSLHVTDHTDTTLERINLKARQRIFYHEYGQLMDTIHSWLSTISENDGESLVKDLYPSFFH